MPRIIKTPEGLFTYNRTTGIAAYVPSLRSKIWTRPLYAQIAITEICDMQPPCPWCYVEASPNKNRIWPVEDLMGLVKFLNSWGGGLLGVAYGGGEPFTHPDIVEIVRRTWSETDLDVSVTTNGFAASEEKLKAIEGHIGEVRVSIYNPKHCNVLEKFLGRRFDLGVNALLMRGSVPSLERTVETCVKMGVNNFLINSFRPLGRGAKNVDMEPTAQDYLQLGRFVEKYGGEAEFKVSGRMAEALKRLAKLQFIPFEKEARGRIIAITVDRKVKPSSLSTEAYPFNSPEEIPKIYRQKIVGSDR